MLVCPMDDVEEGLTERKAEIEGASAIQCSNGEGSVAPRSHDAISNTPSSADGAEAVGVANTGGSVEVRPAADESSDQECV